VITQSGSAAIVRMLASGAVTLGIGVGSGDHPESHASTALAADGVLGAAWHRPLDPTFPAVQDDGSLLVQATFRPHEARFPWREWCLVMADGEITPHHELASTGSGAVMLSRRVPASPLHPLPPNGPLRVLRVPVRFFVPD
jgi:hypothetical protein